MVDDAPTVAPKKSGRRRRLISRLGLARDVGFVSFGKYGQYLTTLLTLPLIARLLGTEGVGRLAIGMSAYFLGALAVDLGLVTFLAAQVNNGRLRHLRGDYLAVRLLSLTILGSFFAICWSAGAPIHLFMIAFGLFAGGVSSLGEDWILIGQSRFGLMVVCQTTGRLAYVVLLLVWLPLMPSAQVALACVFISSLIPVIWTWTIATREHGAPGRPSDLRGIFGLGLPVLLSRMLENSYEQGVATIFSFVLSARSLGHFSASDRLVQAISSLLDAIGFGLLPRLASKKGDPDFWRSCHRALITVAALALTAAITLCLIAPFVIPLVFGREFDSAVNVLRVEAFVLPGTAVASFVTTAILPIFRDTRGILMGSIIGTVVILFFLAIAAMNHSVWALVIGMVAAETIVSVFYIWRVTWLRRHHGSDPVDAPTDAPAGATS